MSTTYTQYIVPCLTESLGVVTGYVNTVPTTCPNNNTHTIDPTGIKALSNLNSKTVVINQTSTAMIGDNYQARSYTLTAAPNAVTTMDITFPYNTTIFLASYLGTVDNIGDSLDVLVAPNTVVGLSSTSLSAGDTTLTLSPMGLVPNVGWLMSITDGVNTDDLGRVLSINPTTGVVVFETPTVNSFSPGVQVRISIQRVKNLMFVNEQNVFIGRTKIVSSVLPANKAIRFMYTNNSGSTKNFYFLLEMGY